jgi:tetratricopeptide (TPR) repeat protein
MAALFYRISANMHNNLKEVKVARPYYQESVRLFEALVAENPSSTYRLGLAESFRDYSQLLNQAGELGAAREALRQCIDRSRKLVTVDPKYAFYRRTLASALLNLSAVEYDAGRYVESRDACKESAAIFAELLRAEPKDLHPYDGLFLAMSHNRSAIYLRETGSPEQALREHGQAVTEAQRVLATSPENNNFRNFVGRALVEQGRTLALKPEGRLSAEKNFSDAILIWRNLRERNPDYPLYKDWLAVADEARATIRLDLGRRPEARNDLAESRQILEELVHDHSESPDFEGHLARTYLTLARLAQADSDRPSAAEWLAKAKAAAAEAIKLAPEDARLKRLDADVLEQSKNGNSPARPE